MSKVFKRALVTGGAGFIGSHIVDRLIQEGIEPIVLDDFSVGKRENLPEGIRIIEGDIRNLKLVEDAMKDVDIVFHQAARVSIRASVDHFVDDANVNIMGTINLIKAMIKYNVSKIIYASSMAVYCNSKNLPIDEGHSIEPNSPYGISKLTAEKYCLTMGKLVGFDAVSLRYFNTFGVRQTLSPYVGVITIFINRLLTNKAPIIFGDGEQIRDFIAVEDVAEANILVMKKQVAGTSINIGSGKGTTVNQIAEILINKINPSIKPVYQPVCTWEPMNSIADISRARSIFGFNPILSINEKLDDMIAWNSETII